MTRLVLAVLLAGLVFMGASANGAALKGDGPTTIATGYGSVWVGTGSGSVIRIDARTRRVVQRIKVHGFVGDLVPAYGSIWVSSGTALVHRIEPATGRVTEIWSRDLWTVTALAVSAGRVWVLDGAHRQLRRIDPARNRIDARLELPPGEPIWLWADPTHLWLHLNSNPKPPLVEDDLAHVRLVALDPADGRLAGPAIETAGWIRYSAGFGSLWATDQIARTLTRLDPSTGRAISSRSDVVSIVAPVAGFGSLWLPDGATVRRLDPRSLATVAAVDATGATLAVGSGAVWLLSTGDGTRGAVTQIDPGTNRVVGRPIPIVPKP
jgi:streptogramin lyase